MELFSKEEVNTKRQFEFDLAKVVCILGMVFVHCFEEFSPEQDIKIDSIYYILVNVLDSVFGAGTFMISMGLGIAYSWNNNPEPLIKRGIKIFILGYVLNIVRSTPYLIHVLIHRIPIGFYDFMSYILCCDIMAFAGLALILFGLLKKYKLSDLVVFLISLGLSIFGSFVRFIDFNNGTIDQLLGVFIGTYDYFHDFQSSCFPLANWFIVVVIGYLYGKAIRHCIDTNKYYMVALPISAIVLAVYMIIAIPKGIGLMNTDLGYYYMFSTPNVIILFMGTVFATSVYHYVGLLLKDKIKKTITRISSNLNRIYCVHWVLIGLFVWIFNITGIEDLSEIANFVLGIFIFIVSNVIVEVYFGRKKKNQSTI